MRVSTVVGWLAKVKMRPDCVNKNPDASPLNARIAEFPWGSISSNATWIYRSTNKGATWSRTQMLDASNGNAATIAT